ncbi:MAG: hypothetical protein DBX59_08005 [Bacillota bacterium]|nr:MAG: hypothetical protein DBX59_08005 [Bacillota bacterium]
MLKIEPGFKRDGEIVQYYNNKVLELASNEFGIHDFSKREAAGARIQSHYTLHFVLKGKGTFSIAGKTFHLQENDAFFTPPNVTVTTTPDKDEPWTFFWAGMNGKGFQQVFANALFSIASPVYSCGACAQFVRNAIERLCDFCPAESDAMQMRGISAALEIFAYITEERVKNCGETPHVFSKEYYLQKALDLIEANYADSAFKIDDICAELAISHSYLCKIFRLFSSVTVNQYLIEIRMREARLLLDKDESSIKNVAFAVGYNDYAYFSKEFKKHFGYTPGQYRKTQRENRKLLPNA